MIQAAIQNATNWITGGRGGYVIFQLNANGQPDEILIMDQPSVESAQKVWRWNRGGMGYSENGYDGPYTTAITQDGAIVADFITAGTMMANIIKGGTLTMGGSNNGNGVISVLNASEREVVRLDNNGAVISGGNINLKSETATLPTMRTWYEGGSDDMYSEISPYGFTEIRDFSTWGLMGTNMNGNGVVVAKYYGTLENPGGNDGIAGMYATSRDAARLFVVGECYVDGTLNVTGTKNRIVDTGQFGKRLLNAYETAVPYFGDIGTGEILEDGYCTVEIDPIFSETVSLDDYVVFLQAEGQGECYIGEKRNDKFMVAGTPGLKFAYEIKAKQKGFENIRLDEYKEGKA